MKEDIKTKYKSKKIGKALYQIPIPKRKIAINVTTSLSICNHKNRWIVALTNEHNWGQRTFKGNETINRSQALLMIQFLTDYVNLVMPTEATALNASLKAATNRLVKTGIELTALAVNNEHRKAIG